MATLITTMHHNEVEQIIGQFLNAKHLEKVKYMGATYTWRNRAIFSEVDRVIANGECFVTLPDICYEVLLEGLFRFYNVWADDPSFKEIIKRNGNLRLIISPPMYQVVANLKRLKPLPKNLYKNKFNEVHEKGQLAYVQLLQKYKEIQLSPFDNTLPEQEKVLL
ncbi:hypothetical protein Cgig2_001294 [Carnegiea gigantea]|uniref:Uncharacterized protein n=1 Tax=Carnegiea gigantea TaxID=171969 RepID=A0A9Q1KK86_9CARY|nr:hypothetical protein Cgig2_001294 [Carnegiea gigantea]